MIREGATERETERAHPSSRQSDGARHHSASASPRTPRSRRTETGGEGGDTDMPVSRRCEEEKSTKCCSLFAAQWKNSPVVCSEPPDSARRRAGGSVPRPSAKHNARARRRPNPHFSARPRPCCARWRAAPAAPLCARPRRPPRSSRRVLPRSVPSPSPARSTPPLPLLAPSPPSASARRSPPLARAPSSASP